MPPGSDPPPAGLESSSKRYFRIGEVATLVGVEPHVLRYWEREFRSIRPTKSAKGQRVYSRRDLELLLRVRDLLYKEGFTIAGAKKKLAEVRGLARPTFDNEPDVPSATPEIAQAAAEQAPPERAQAKPNERPEHSRERADKKMRQALVDLRAEIEGFLADLGQ